MYNVVYKRKELYQTNSLAKAKAKAISYSKKVRKGYITITKDIGYVYVKDNKFLRK